MTKKSQFALVLSVSLCLLLHAPGEVLAAPQSAGQRAGEVARVIPAVSIARGAQTITASSKSTVNWQDLLNTQVNGRARVALDDGSVLNVGSDSSIKVTKHDSGAQQTELELAYGKLRTQAQKISKPDGKFEVRTPAGVAGVVGTDWFTGFENGTMNVIVFEGVVKVCNLAGACVEVKAGQMTSVRSGDNSAPLQPTQAPLDMLITAGNNTEVGGKTPGIGQTAHHLGKGTGITLGILAIVPAVVIPVVITHGNNSPAPVTRCNPQTNPNCG